MDAVELFESRKVWLRLIQRGHGAGDDHGVRMAALTGQHRHSADGLKDQIYRAGGQIGGGGVLREITEVGSGHVGVQRGGRVPGNVADGEIHMAQIPLSGQLFDLVEAFHTHQLAAETTQRAAADTAAAKVPHFFSGFRPQKGGAGTHRPNYAGGLTGQSQRTGAAGLKFIHPAGGQAEHIPVHIAGANAGQNDPAHISEGETVAGQVVAQCAVQAGDLILRPDPEHGDHAAVGPQPYDLCSRAANINT